MVLVCVCAERSDTLCCNIHSSQAAWWGHPVTHRLPEPSRTSETFLPLNSSGSECLSLSSWPTTRSRDIQPFVQDRHLKQTSGQRYHFERAIVSTLQTAPRTKKTSLLCLHLLMKTHLHSNMGQVYLNAASLPRREPTAAHILNSLNGKTRQMLI